MIGIVSLLNILSIIRQLGQKLGTFLKFGKISLVPLTKKIIDTNLLEKLTKSIFPEG